LNKDELEELKVKEGKRCRGEDVQNVLTSQPLNLSTSAAYSSSSSSKGFTLIELLIATAMISAISVSIFYFAFSSIRLMFRAIDLSNSDQAVRFVSGRISSDVMQSSGPGAGSGPDKLIIGNITYEFRDNKVRREERSDVYYLTTEGEIKGLKFSYPSSKLIKVEITPKYGGAYYLNVYARN
jgi:prepilin-type N-terminal cleavage/methylation domain-containing protein